MPKHSKKISAKRNIKASVKPIEQYEHLDKKRINNPHIGLVNESTDAEYGQNKKTYKYDPHLDPELTFDPDKSKDLALNAFASLKDALAKYLNHSEEIAKRQKVSKEEIENLESERRNLLEYLKVSEGILKPNLKWAGKAERTSFDVPVVSLHVHERIDPKTIIDSVKASTKHDDSEQLSLFEKEKKPLREAIEFYKHKEGWSNRLVAGDSLLIMNSLLEKEGMGGKVQMVFFDPPYGIKYGSNFQPFVNKRDVKDGNDDDLTQEPEMIKAFRDTWELGIHSYLSYLRDRLLLAKELLHESGSVFVQISDENVHRVRCLLDEVFGEENFFSEIVFKKNLPLGSAGLAGIFDYIICYAKDKTKIKYRQLYEDKPIGAGTGYTWVEEPTGIRRKMTSEERNDPSIISENCKIFFTSDLASSGYTPSCFYSFEMDGRLFEPTKRSWKTNYDGMMNLIAKKRIMASGKLPTYIRYFDDFPMQELHNMWDDTHGASDLIYVVQTSQKPIQRCILMSTDPSDLILDITCGSGTTAFVAEQWGRRWITCDTSRVAVALAKQRLLTADYDYYPFAQRDEGISSGFQYKTVPHITLKSIANNEPPGIEVLFDHPKVDNSKARVTGPFTVESIPAPFVKNLDKDSDGQSYADESVTRSGETLRQDEWRDELQRTGARGKGGAILQFSRIETQEGTRYIQAVGETKEAKPQKVLIVFGTEHAPLDTRVVELAIEEARQLKPNILLFCAFQFDEEAAKDIDETPEKLLGFKLLKAIMNMDLQTEDLKKQKTGNQSFWLIGQPDVRVKDIEKGDNKGRVQIEVAGFDYYNPKTGEINSEGANKIAMWMLDTDYDGRSLFPRQIFFPMAGPKDGWAKLSKNLKAEIDEEKIEAFRGTVSLPFTPGKLIAVKIIDDRGIESLKIIKR